MIITLEEAQAINPEYTEDDILALEVAVREITNNNFQRKQVRFRVQAIEEPNVIVLNGPPRGIREGDRVELNNTEFNNQLHTIKSIDGNRVEVTAEDLYEERNGRMILTRIDYPADVKKGVKKLLEYETKTAKNIGVKSRSISRVTETYYDVTSGENVNGYPASLFDFVKKYRRLKWGQ